MKFRWYFPEKYDSATKKCEMKISIINCFNYNNIDDDDYYDKYAIKMKKQLYTDKNKINGIWTTLVKLCSILQQINNKQINKL